MLPASKSDFPKCLCLDQNKWIDLARAHYGKQGGESFQDALRAVRTAIDSGKLVVPFSAVNAVEAMISRDSGRRERLARFVVELSGNRTVLPEHAACALEIRNAVRRLFGTGSPQAVRPSILQQGLIHALGMVIEVLGSAEKMEAGVAHIRSSQLTVEFLLMVSGKREGIDQALVGEMAAVGIFEQDRDRFAAMSLEQRRWLEFLGLFFGTGRYRADLATALRDLNIHVRDFRARVHSPQDAMRFLADVPNLDVLLTLRLARDQDLSRAIERNDIRDLDWISVAVPYSNIVVAENYWGHKVRATGLDGRYGTVLITDLRTLPEQLQTMGCS
jgi:hypothetical protein